MHRIDLHTHSFYSDGTASPSSIVAAAAAAKVELLALSDHDNIDGGGEGIKAAQAFNLPFQTAVEISTNLHDQLHILGYNIAADDSNLLKSLEHYRKMRRERMEEILRRLASAGIPITPEEVLARAKGTTGRPHIADLLTKKGFSHSRQEAFQKYLVPGRPSYVKPAGPDVKEAISLIKGAGGIPILAHPGTIMNHLDIPLWRSYGLEGLEIYYPAHSVSVLKTLFELAKDYSLLVTAGSDYHGAASGRDNTIGVEVPDDIFKTARETFFRS